MIDSLISYFYGNHMSFYFLIFSVLTDRNREEGIEDK